MPETIRLIPMRGFTAAVAREAATDGVAAGSVAVGVDGDGNDRRIVITTRHADGTLLTAFLSDAGIDRLAHLLADLVGEAAFAPIGATVTIQ